VTTRRQGKSAQIELSFFWSRLIDELLEFFQRADLAGKWFKIDFRSDDPP
jgi:hypothetical protein